MKNIQILRKSTTSK